ncbi:MAG: TetR/AcrR family transcriptional regulator [Sphingomonadales bacterium]|nr:TetR/AcrR family transcriptional regulator [Sphingomonadales bacterium]MDE2170763.1 TetR/AcrR family transcriptional regulator [Sphingomonadales bacterium]
MSRTGKAASLKPRKAATQMRASRTVEAIVEAAARILETVGMEGYTTNAVAARAGVSIGSLYQYFPNKDAITVALIEREAALLLTQVNEAAAEPEWKAALKLMITAAVRHQLSRPVLSRLLDVEEARLPTRDEAAPGSGAIFKVVRAVIARAMPATALPGLSSVVEQLASDVIGITRGMTDMAGRRHEADGLDLALRVENAVCGYLFSALKQMNSHDLHAP